MVWFRRDSEVCVAVVMSEFRCGRGAVGEVWLRHDSELCVAVVICVFRCGRGVGVAEPSLHVDENGLDVRESEGLRFADALRHLDDGLRAREANGR